MCFVLQKFVLKVKNIALLQIIAGLLTRAGELKLHYKHYIQDILIELLSGRAIWLYPVLGEEKP